MKFLYIGQYSKGSTSKMRADTLAEILHDWQFDVIDTNIPFYETSRIMRSLGFRYKIGFVIKNINDYVKGNLNGTYDVIWVDKAIFITEETTKILKNISSKLIHFSPDPAFTYHRSNHFLKSIKHYNYAITTKTYEIEYYKKYIKECKLLISTQGFDKNLHKPCNTYEEKNNSLLFIGHYEKARGKFIKLLLDNKISVTVAGAKWESFVNKNKNAKNLGPDIYGKKYAETISAYTMSWGAISKWIPELHTTRTFEIPACGTALITERNKEIESFFNDKDVIFYSSEQEFINRIKYFIKNPSELKQVSNNGYMKVISGGYDYRTILIKLLKQTEII